LIKKQIKEFFSTENSLQAKTNNERII